MYELTALTFEQSAADSGEVINGMIVLERSR